jgi:ubiquinone/menaquinone biosynthesis C-methylase UbiE
VSAETVHHPIFARVYARLSPRAEAAGAAEHRDELLNGLRGRVIEVGAGNGLNFAHYGAAVTEVLAVEPEAHLRGHAQLAAGHASVPITVVDGVASQLPAGDATFDAAVSSLVLCSVPDQAAALAELHRVIRPGGELRFYEHVVSNRPRFAALQRRLDDWNVWPQLAGGCHLARDTASAIAAAGFIIEPARRFPFRAGPVAIAHILGTARRP